MPRNRYTKIIRALERTQFDHQAKKLRTFVRKLRRVGAVPVAVSVIEMAEEQHRVRLERKRQNKPKRSVIVTEVSRSAAAMKRRGRSVEITTSITTHHHKS